MTDPLRRVLAASRAEGHLGPAAPEELIEHALGFGDLRARSGGRCLDLGAGGGVPGLVLALDDPDASWVLLDARDRRTSFLGWAVQELGVGDRVEVVHGRAEDAGWDEELRDRFDTVTARAFGPPSTTVECAVGFLRRRGELIVSDPPTGAGDRWPAEGLARAGLRARSHAAVRQRSFTVLERTAEELPSLPRRPGPVRREPLF